MCLPPGTRAAVSNRRPPGRPIHPGAGCSIRPGIDRSTCQGIAGARRHGPRSPSGWDHRGVVRCGLDRHPAPMKAVCRPVLAGLALAVLLPFAMATGTSAATTAPLRPLTSGQVAHRLSREVYGFLPYWLRTSKTPGSLRYDLLSGPARRPDRCAMTCSAPSPSSTWASSRMAAWTEVRLATPR